MREIGLGRRSDGQDLITETKKSYSFENFHISFVNLLPKQYLEIFHCFNYCFFR